MIRFFLTLWVGVCFVIGLSAQDSAAHLPAGSVRLEAGTSDDAESRFLTAIYQNIQYPQTARAYGITGAVFVTYTIDTAGGLTVKETRYFSPEELAARPMRIRESDVLRVVAYSVGGPAYTGTATTNKKRLKRGQADLSKEVARTLRQLPTFVPARRAGQTVEEIQIKLVYFDIE
ncbi:hypothetical protein CLV84_1295 [Neolewinella xylanilytica]|uniref:TonB-like protein n=1 Tax=Neolewinella xylanilytica TaxID=1514080 RepID=A0A2S6IA07_9BACT|nr:hypothetical protein [Neolewinella xylanilytica]PPK88330.1 hypothetical protein CLV84_1295 [Neolewinella xylanilytica]